MYYILYSFTRVSVIIRFFVEFFHSKILQRGKIFVSTYSLTLNILLTRVNNERANCCFIILTRSILYSDWQSCLGRLLIQRALKERYKPLRTLSKFSLKKKSIDKNIVDLQNVYIHIIIIIIHTNTHTYIYYMCVCIQGKMNF